MAGKETFMSDQDSTTVNDPSGYKYEFLDKVPEDLYCWRCKCVAREPNHTSCCGESFCMECISPYHRDNQPCPSCSETNFCIFLDKRDKRKIQSLKLSCPMKSCGCEWTGRLDLVESHVDIHFGDCLYVNVPCPSHCNKMVQKHYIQDHLSRECPLREYTCTHCNFKASYKVVSEVHLEICPYFPVQCPNRCGVTCEREILEDHMKMCDKEELECCFSHAGCPGKFLREEEEKHMEEKAKKHLSLMATTTLKILVEIEKDKERSKEMVREQEKKFQEHLQEQEVIVQKKLQEKLQERELKFQKKLQEQEIKCRDESQRKEKQLEKIKQELEEKERKVIETEIKCH